LILIIGIWIGYGASHQVKYIENKTVEKPCCPASQPVIIIVNCSGTNPVIVSKTIEPTPISTMQPGNNATGPMDPGPFFTTTETPLATPEFPFLPK
jgi:hypothetical protein